MLLLLSFILPMLVLMTSSIVSPKVERLFLLFFIFIFFNSFFCNSILLILLLVCVSLLLINGNPTSPFYSHKQLRDLSISLLLITYVTFTLFECTSLFEIFVLFEILLVVSLICLAGEQNLSQHSILYLLINVFLGIAYLIGIVLMSYTFGTLDIEHLTILHFANVVSFDIGSLLLMLVLLCKLSNFPLNLVLPQIYQNLNAPALLFFSIAFIVPYFIILLFFLEMFPPFISSSLFL